MAMGASQDFWELKGGRARLGAAPRRRLLRDVKEPSGRRGPWRERPGVGVSDGAAVSDSPTVIGRRFGEPFRAATSVGVTKFNL